MRNILTARPPRPRENRDFVSFSMSARRVYTGRLKHENFKAGILGAIGEGEKDIAVPLLTGLMDAIFLPLHFVGTSP